MYPTPLPGPPQDQAHFLGVLAKLDDRICALIGQGHHLGDGYDHAYQADAAVCLALVNAGATDAEIRAIYVSHHQGIGRALLERGERYLWRTIAWAREIANDYQEVVAQMVWNNGEHVTVILGGAQGDREGLVVKQKLWPEREGWRWPFVHAGSRSTTAASCAWAPGPRCSRRTRRRRSSRRAPGRAGATMKSTMFPSRRWPLAESGSICSAGFPRRPTTASPCAQTVLVGAPRLQIVWRPWTATRAG
jgi:hypothetical protein